MLGLDLETWLMIFVTLGSVALVYAYLVFPILMTIIGRRPVKQSSSGDLPSVSLIIPAYNEQEVIQEKVRNSLAIDYPNLEIVIASDGSDDATNDLVDEFEASNVRLLRFDQRRGKSSVLNDAIEQTTGEVICLCDANVLFQPDALRVLVPRLMEPGVGAVSGDVRLMSQDSSFGFAESLYYQLERGIQSGESKLGSMIGVDGGMYVIRRDLFCPLPPATILDDFTISINVLRSGNKVLYAPDAIAYENATESARSEFKRRLRIGSGAAQVVTRGIFPSFRQPLQLWLFLSHKLLRWISPLLLVVAILSLGRLSVDHTLSFVMLIGCIILLGLALLGSVSSRLRRHWLFSVPFYFVMSQIAMGLGLIKGLLFRQTAIWDPTERNSLKNARGAKESG